MKNKTREIVGSDYRDTDGLRTLKNEISQDTSGAISFIDIYEVYPEVDGEVKRVVMFQIPAAISAVPTAWKGHEYARDGESLKSLSQEKRERIRRQTFLDWSKQFVKGAKVEHLNRDAIWLAREKYKEKMSDEHISTEVDSVSDEEFLEARKLAVNGRITNAAMLLLGDERYDWIRFKRVINCKRTLLHIFGSIILWKAEQTTCILPRLWQNPMMIKRNI